MKSLKKLLKAKHFKTNNKNVDQLIKFFDHHHSLGIIMFVFTFVIIAIALNVILTSPARQTAKAYFPNNCNVPVVPRGKTCSSGWQITTDDHNCRIFTCQE